jgi:hypothetical protein
MMSQLELPTDIPQIGDRVIIFERLPTQECGTVVDFIPVWCADGLYPVMMTDLGVRKVVSYAWRFRKLAPVEQLNLL